MDDAAYEESGGDFYETTEYESYGGRVKNSFGGLCVGPLLMVASIILLVWNEGRNLHRLKDLQEAQDIVKHVNDVSSIDQANEGALLHFTGETETSSYLYDEAFGIQVTAVKLLRTVETYQWVEEETTRTTKTSNGGTKETKRYEYERTWRNGIENSNQFYSSENHQNPEQPLYEDASYVADSVTLGAYALSATVISSMNWYQTLHAISADTVQVDNDEYTLQVVQDHYFYFGQDPSNPQVGDIRVSFSYVPTGETSIIAEQSGQYLTPYYTSRGGSILLVQQGYASIVEMFAKAKLENALVTWGLRALGWIVSFVGMSMLIQPISVVMDIVPFVGSLVDMGLSCVAFLVSTTISATVIALAWLFYRPLVGFGLLLLIGGVLYCVTRRARALSADGTPAVKPPYGSNAASADYVQYPRPHYPTSYQNHHPSGLSGGGTTAIPFAQALDSPFIQQTSASPAVTAPVLGPPVVLPPSKDVPVVFKPL